MFSIRRKLDKITTVTEAPIGTLEIANEMRKHRSQTILSRRFHFFTYFKSYEDKKPASISAYIHVYK